MKGNRPVRVDAQRDGIAWTDDGSNVAVRVRAIDNKDRWIANVDLANGALVPVHRISDAPGSTAAPMNSAGCPTRLSQRLIELKKDHWEMASYPMERHGFVQPEAWYDQYCRIYQLFNRTLK